MESWHWRTRKTFLSSVVKNHGDVSMSYLQSLRPVSLLCDAHKKFLSAVNILQSVRAVGGRAGQFVFPPLVISHFLALPFPLPLPFPESSFSFFVSLVALAFFCCAEEKLEEKDFNWEKNTWLRVCTVRTGRMLLLWSWHLPSGSPPHPHPLEHPGPCRPLPAPTPHHHLGVPSLQLAGSTASGELLCYTPE